MQRIGLFLPAPPEHNAHVINSVSMYTSLVELYPDQEFVWITMNPRLESQTINPRDYLADYGLEEYAQMCDVEVLNCAHLVADEFHPQPSEIEAFLVGLNCSAIYMHFYPPFWETVREVCDRNQIFFGLHVKIFYRKPGLPFYFEHDANALRAVKNIDFLSVSQEQDRQELHQVLGIPREKIIVLPKSVPQQILQNARQGKINSDSVKQVAAELSSQKENCLKIGYVGRFEEIKNIEWFLETCMPALQDLSSKFTLTLVGRGSKLEQVEALATPYENVKVVSQVLGYLDTLALLNCFDRILYPSGFDFAPRLPLETFLMGKRCVLTDVHFNHRYRPYGIMVPSTQDQESLIEYNDVTICFALPDADALVAALRQEILHPDDSFTVPVELEQESDPRFVARRLMEYLKTHVET